MVSGHFGSFEQLLGRKRSSCRLIFFLNAMNTNDVVDLIKEGVMVGPASQQAAEIGRQYTKRQMPW